jgi:voltage-gated potassium channel
VKTHAIRPRIEYLYTAHTPAAVRFRYGLIVFDALTILFFVSTASVMHGFWLTLVSYLVGFVILCDLVARVWIAEDKRFILTRLYTIGDILVLVSLFLDPFIASNVAFVRILRGLRLIHSYHLLQDLRRDSRFFRDHEETVIAVTNLFVFVFLTAITVLVFFMDPGTSETPYIDALYFTIATLTTTGFGDITLTTPVGKLFSVFVMVVGVTLFVRLAQAVIRPHKVRFRCPDCSLLRHDPDAVHCKHCGRVLNIESEGSL